MEPVFILDLRSEYAKSEKEREVKENDVNEEDITNMLDILDNFAKSDTGRLKLKVSDEVKAGKSERVYHHGRCDVGSPFARGDAYDVLEDKDNTSCF